MKHEKLLRWMLEVSCEVAEVDSLCARCLEVQFSLNAAAAAGRETLLAGWRSRQMSFVVLANLVESGQICIDWIAEK